jgi:hypothetical protein
MSARVNLSSSPPTLAQAVKLTRALASSYSQELPEDRLNAITEIFLRFPLPVAAACVHPWTGIACTKIRDRTGRSEPRRFPPSNGELRDWCEDYLADLYKLARAHDVAERHFREIEKPVVPPSPEEIARVWARVDEIKERCKRVLGVPTLEEQRDVAQSILNSAMRGASLQPEE